MKLKIKALRIFLMWRTYQKSLKKSKEMLLITQQKGIEICKGAINHRDSELRIDIETNKRYICVGDIDIDLSDNILTITNHVYHYNISLPDRLIIELQQLFDVENGRRCRKIEYEKKVNITISLDNILKQIKS